MCADPCFAISCSDAAGDVEEAVQIGRQHRGIVLVGVVGERLGDEDAGIVDQRVDLTELLERLLDDALGSLGIADVARDRQDIRVRTTA